MCRATILESASICPGCRHHLRFDAHSPEQDWTSFFPLRIEGTIRHPREAEPWEYSIVLSIRDGEGQEITRQVVGVGALESEEERAFDITVEVLTPTTAENETSDPHPMGRQPRE